MATVRQKRRFMYASSTRSSQARRPVFVTTRWSEVLAAGKENSNLADAAMERLCRAYWYPLYAYVRRRGHSPEDAQDLTQAFFARLIENHSVTAADPHRGRFRSYLLKALDNFLITDWKRSIAEKRGGAAPPLSLDWARANERYDLEPADTVSPDKRFEKEWALALLNEALTRLEGEFERDGKLTLFTALKQTLIGSRESQPYAALARQLGLTENAVKVAVHRLRLRYRQRIREEITHTLGPAENVEQELKHLFNALAGD